jgi:hypothetical protein
MRCDECLPRLDQYVEDEFDEQTAKSLAAHMATCRECASAHETLRREQEIYASYLRDVEPPPDLGANLRLQLEMEKVRRGSQPLLQRWLATALGELQVTPQMATALVLIIIGLVIGILVWRTTIVPSRHEAQDRGAVGVQPSSEVNREVAHHNSDNTDGRGSANDDGGKVQSSSSKGVDRGREIQVGAAGRAARRVGRSPALSKVDQVVLRAERQYLSAIEILSRDVKRGRAVISPALLSQLETALAEVDRNIAATRRVAREQPRDPDAVQYLALAYEKKVELLREVISRLTE